MDGLHLEILPQAQQQLWNQLNLIPDYFVLYGGTGLALQLGHRQSIDFDFFTNNAVSYTHLTLPTKRIV